MRPNKPGCYWWEDSDGGKHVAEFDSFMETAYSFGPDGILEYGSVEELEDQIEFSKWLGPVYDIEGRTTEKALEEHRNGKWVLYGSGGRTTEKALEEHRNGKWVLYDDVEEYLLEDEE